MLFSKRSTKISIGQIVQKIVQSGTSNKYIYNSDGYTLEGIPKQITYIITHSYIKNRWKIRIDTTWFSFILN